MLYNYHTHTVRCGHATGEDEEYILSAIEAGVEEMGFSDHGPFRHENGFEMGHRVPTARAEEYISSIRALREKYKDKIRLHIGFEVEYCPKYFKAMLAYWRKIGTEYLILGNHILGDELVGHCHSMNAKTEEQLVHYVDCVIAAMESGVFTYVAHPDMIGYPENDCIYDREMRRLAEASKRTGVPVEINCLGIRSGRHYPNPAFWKIAGEVGCPVVIGFDAHTAQDAGLNSQRDRALEIVKEFHLNYLENPKIVRI